MGLFVGNPDVTIPTITIETDLKNPIRKRFIEIQLPQYDFPIRIITTPYERNAFKKPIGCRK
jgi:exonuclease SbcD